MGHFATKLSNVYRRYDACLYRVCFRVQAKLTLCEPFLLSIKKISIYVLHRGEKVFVFFFFFFFVGCSRLHNRSYYDRERRCLARFAEV